MQKENIGCYKKSMSCREVVTRHLRIFVFDGIINGRKEIRRSWIKSGMTPLFNNNAFTLIELLVVVLIIGILAAVAVPQYQKAVEKSKATQVMALLKSLGNAQESYRLANGEYATSFDELSVDVPWTGTNKWWNHSAIADTRSNNDWSLQILYDEDAGNKGIIAGKLSGQFAKKGGLIWLYQYDEDPSVPLNRPLCIENTSSITAGSYCTKILNATLVHTASIRYFTLQY